MRSQCVPGSQKKKKKRAWVRGYLVVVQQYRTCGIVIFKTVVQRARAGALEGTEYWAANKGLSCIKG